MVVVPCSMKTVAGVASGYSDNLLLRAGGIVPDYVAGHSLGEYSALVSAGSLSFPDAIRLVRRRGA